MKIIQLAQVSRGETIDFAILDEARPMTGIITEEIKKRLLEHIPNFSLHQVRYLILPYTLGIN